ncbi:LexA family protein [Bdellovibrionota bacterium]
MNAQIINTMGSFQESVQLPISFWEREELFCVPENELLFPLSGSHATCGLFGISEDFTEKYLSLDERFIQNKASTYFFEAESDSMKPLICPGDILIVDRSLECRSGRVVVASISGEFVCKRFVRTADGVVLRSENRAYRDINVTEEMELVVFGVVRGIARELVTP